MLHSLKKYRKEYAFHFSEDEVQEFRDYLANSASKYQELLSISFKDVLSLIAEFKEEQLLDDIEYMELLSSLSVVQASFRFSNKMPTLFADQYDEEEPEFALSVPEENFFPLPLEQNGLNF